MMIMQSKSELADFRERGLIAWTSCDVLKCALWTFEQQLHMKLWFTISISDFSIFTTIFDHNDFYWEDNYFQ